MAGKIYRYLTDDHARLEDALQRATRDPDHIDRTAYAEFREGLLRHIGMEEKILFPPRDLQMAEDRSLQPPNSTWIMEHSTRCLFRHRRM